uniref:C3H1-type domain-containing protein n=1 Tax=viral metagenome TaxID=1070528 RepID=A0A6C0H8T6_9ZZZZ
MDSDEEQLAELEALTDIDPAEMTACMESHKNSRNTHDKHPTKQVCKIEPKQENSADQFPVLPPPCGFVRSQLRRSPKTHSQPPNNNWPKSFLSMRLPSPLINLSRTGRCITPKTHHAEPLCGCGCLNYEDFHAFMRGLESYNANPTKYTGTKATYCRWKRIHGDCVTNGCQFNHEEMNPFPCIYHFTNNQCKHGEECLRAHDQGRTGDIPKPPKIPGLSIQLGVHCGRLVVMVRKV